MTQTIDAHDLVLLIEEAGEVIQEATKILRFGPNDRGPGRSQTNIEELAKEIGHFTAIADRIPLPLNAIIRGNNEKHEKLKSWGQTSHYGRGLLGPQSEPSK